MGLIQAGLSALSTVLADQWKEFFVCESMPADVLVCKGEKRTGSKSSNTKGSDNIISNGSGIVVNEGQAMIIVEQGEIVEFCAEPGEFTFDTSSEPSIFTGKFGESLLETFKVLGRRFTYGGDTGKDQRIYYFNTKEILDNKFGTPNPIPFRVVDNKINLDIDVSLSCSGTYSYNIVDPMIFYAKVCGNVSDCYRRSQIDAELKAEFISALQPSVGMLTNLEIRPSQLPNHTAELEAALKNVLNRSWTEGRGIEINKVNLTTAKIPDDQQEIITNAQKAAMYKDPALAAAYLVSSTGEAVVDAANNPGGAVNGILGVNMLGGAGMGSTISDLFGKAGQQPAAAPAGGWTCPTCGSSNSGNFCPTCGGKKPEPAGGWTCPTCGSSNNGNFCPNCGTKKPEAAAKWTCPVCGAQNEGNFCPNCGYKKQ